MPIDLKISKSGSQTVGLGTDVSYLIEYQRLSGGDVTATITDTLPRGTTYVDSTLGTPTSISGNSYSWQVTIATSAVQSATITVHVPETLTIGTSLTNHVAIIPSDDSNWTDNFDTWTSTTDESITDVEILKYGSWQAIPGGKIVYSFWLNNIGETPITAATITDKLPIGLTYVTNTNQRMMGTAAITEWTRQDIQVPQQGTVTGIGATLVWTIHNTLPAGSRTLTEVLLDVCPHIVQYSTTQSASQTLGYTNEYIINNIRVETTPQDNNIENNEDTHITQIAHITNADLYIGKSGPYESCPGNVIRYRIYGGNYGYSDAGGVKLVDTMPIGVTLESIEYAYAGGLQIGTTPTTMATITGWGNRKQQVLTWNIGTISANSGIYTTSFPDTVQPNRFYLNITARIADNILPTGWTSINLDNTVEISTTSPENSLYRNTCAVKTIVIPRQVDLHIWKSGPRECAPNDRIAYNIGCYNNGPDMAHTVTITDTLPPGVEYATDTSGLPLDIGTLSTGGQRLTWTVGTLCALSNYGYWWQYYKSFKLEVKVGTLTINTSLTNKVEIKSMDVEKTPANNNAKCRTIVKCPAVDLTIKKYGPAKVIRGDNNDLWYYIWFTNNGNTTADNVTIVDTLPHGAKYKNYYGSCYNWLYNRYQRIGTPTLSPNKQVVTWEIGDLPPNSSGYITLMVNANTEGYANQQDMYNKVTISSQQPDSNPNNNYADYKTRVVNPVTNLHVIKHGPKKVSPGQEMTYTIHYGNAGNTAARDIEIVDTLDKGVTYMSSGIDYKYPPQIIGDKVIWRIPRIRHGFNTNFDVRVLVAGSISTKVICNKVVITVLPTDHNPKNNSSEWKTRVVEQKADLSVVITADIARPGFKKNLYVTCTNEGTGKADNVVVTLRLPAKNHATYDYSCPQGDYNASLNTVTWSVGSLPPDKSKHYRAKILVKASTPRGTRLYSKATVSTTSQESDNKNNKAREHEDVIRSYDPNMKTASPQDYVAATATSISYTIHFENIGQANATKIKLDDQLTDKLDWSTVAIKDVCVGGTVSTISEFNIQLRDKLKAKLDPLVPSQYTQEEADEIVEMSGLRVWWHPSMGTVSWEFDFGDYEFGLPPNNPLDEGTGWVRFTVNTIGTLTSGTEIENQATIKFDYNEPMNTPVVKHIVDGTAPVSGIILDPYQVSSTFTVGWLGTDQVGKIDSYEVYAAKDNGTPTLWGSFVENSASYVGIVGSTYTFSCKARDMAGNVGSMSDAVSTRVLPPATEAGTLTRVIISPASVSMELDETIMLTAQGFNENGELMAGISYSWGTSTGFAVIGTPTNAVTVKAIGIGSVTMRVTAAKNAASATTTGTYTISTGALDRITIEGTPTSMELNQQVMFVGRGFNKFGAEIPGQTFTWRIQDAEVGSITAAGTTSTSATVTAKTSGSGWVTAIAGEKQGTLQISVGDGIVATVTVSGTTTLQLGQAAVFTAKAYNKFGCELPDKIATWEIAPAPPLCNFTPSGASSAMLTAQAPGIGTLTGTADDIHGHLAITIIQGMPTKLAITQSAQTVSAGIASEAIVVQAQNEFSASVDVTSPMTVTVTSDSLLSRFSTAASGAAWTSGTAATYVIPAGTGSISLYHKYNGTATPAIAITVNAANMTAASQSITITALGTASAGNIVADDGKTMVTLKAGDLVGASFIEINTNPTPPGVNAPDGLVIMAQTLRQIKLIGAGLSSGTTVTVTLPYSEVNLVGNGEDSLQPYRLGTSSTTWESISNISRNTVNNTVSGVVGSFSFFALMMPAWNTTLKNVVVYPNPCITEKHGYQMYFANLTQNSTIKIFNIAGELVKEIAVDNPTEIWKIDNDDGERVASGLYIYLITDPASNRKVGKMAIIK
ncbi:DUF11 domain-containing protein, partial [bacterium]|nr:DUF11 domain-containing protein [bacterium]